MTERSALWKRAALKGGLILLAFATLIVLVWRLPTQEWLEQFNTWVAGLGMIGIVIFVAVYAVAAVAFVPASALTVGAGFAFGLGWGMVAVSAGSTAGAGLAFLVSRYIARDWVRRKMAVGERFQAIDEAVSEQGWKIVGLLRLSPVFPYNALNYLLGLTGVRFWHYLAASWVGMLPGTFLYVYLGYAGKISLEAATSERDQTLRYIYLGLGLIATIAVTVYVTRLARRAIRQKTNLNSNTDAP